jgi:hypothetical protein
VRVIVARRAAPPPGRKNTVGRQVGEWVYELFLTTLPLDGFLAEDAWNLYHSRGASAPVLADEDMEVDSDRWCSYTECGKATVANCVSMGLESASVSRKTLQGGELREMEWAPPKEAILLVSAPEPASEEYGHGPLAGEAGRAQGQIAGSANALARGWAVTLSRLWLPSG